MTFLVLTTIAAVVYGLVSKRYERALAIGGITPAGVALAGGGFALPTFYAVAIGGLVLLVVQWLARAGKPGKPRLNDIPGVILLLAFLAWSLVVTVLAPMIFPGLQTITPDERILAAGVLSPSNIGQLVYLALGIAVVVIVARSTTTSPFLLAIPLGGALTLSLWRYFSVQYGVPFPEDVFSNSPTLHYVERAAGDVVRFRGIFSEPSALAGCALIATAYGTSLLARTRGIARLGALAMVVVAVFLGIVSTSTTFLVAGVVLALFAIVVQVLRLVSMRVSISAPVAISILAVLGAAVLAIPALLAQFTAALDDKVGSDSFVERSGADQQSYGVFLQSWGLGVGLGSGRASSFLATLLSTVGVIGTVLFAAVLVVVVARAAPLRPYHPVIWALVATMIGKLIAGPDVSDPSGVFWLSLGILAHGIIAAQRGGSAPFASTRSGSRGACQMVCVRGGSPYERKHTGGNRQGGA